MALVIVSLVLLAAFLVLPGGPVAGTTAATVAGLVAGVACLVRAARRPGRRIRLTWTAVGLAALAWVLGRQPGLSAGAGDLVMVALVATARFLVPVPRQSVHNRVRTAVDAMLIVVSVLMVNALFVMEPATALGGPGMLGPLGNVLLASAALTMLAQLRRGVPDAGPLVLVGAALLVVAGADSFAIRVALGLAPGMAPIPEAGWIVGFGLLAIAAARPHTGGTRAPAADVVTPWYSIQLPYVIVALALVTGVTWLANGGHTSAVGTWSWLALLLLIVARQVIVMLENRQLARDLEARVAARSSELQAREQRFRALVDQSSDSLAILEADSTVRYQSESVERIFGVPASALIGRKFIDLAGRRAGAAIAAAIAEVLGTPRATTVFEVTVRHGDGRYRLSEMTITNLLDDPYVHGLVFNTRDIGDAQELQDQLRHEAYYDALTGLVNRALFRERLATAVADHEVTILFLDLDGFKEVNDSLGHAAGDQLLVQFAERLRQAVPESYTVARLGGDEFAVIATACVADAVDLAGRILADLVTPFLVDDRELHVGAGIGIASSADAGDIEQLQRNADLAMYKAKDAGGDSFAVYHPSMHDALVQRLELAADLRLALDRDELVLHYQPTVDLRTGAITGFEALVRWQHPTRGMVPPLEFIGVAESTGLIVPLGRWVLTEACRQAVAWEAGPERPLKMAVNVSVRQFDAGDLAVTVAEVLAATGMPADQLCLEMTESVLLTDTQENLAHLLRLKALGVLLAMDDFGTGYSSLAYLRRFPMDVLKVDRSFVDRLGGDREDEALVRTIVRLGQRFGMTTVAEGIEDATQLAILQEMGCDFAQGYYLSRPVPADAATRLLATGLSTPVAA
ncbi:putative bifunctional diguanylate cyclase/phosphodiesterase [Micromonosporaceae bacterium Da 78-11]